MKTLSWLFVALAFTACASKTTPLTDKGPKPAVDPYDHRKNPQYTTGAMAGFRSLFVDPATYPATMTPAEPPPAPPIQIVGPELPEGLLPAIVVNVNLDALNEKQTFESLVTAVTDSRDGAVVQMPSSGLLFFPAPDGEKLQSRSIRRLTSTQFSGTNIGAVAEISVSEGLPKAAENAMVREAPEGSNDFLITLVPRPPAPAAPKTGDLQVENTTTAWAEVSINDQKIGIIGPLAHGTIENVQAGTYRLHFKLPNGYQWEEKRMTHTEQ